MLGKVVFMFIDFLCVCVCECEAFERSEHAFSHSAVQSLQSHV